MKYNISVFVISKSITFTNSYAITRYTISFGINRNSMRFIIYFISGAIKIKISNFVILKNKNILRFKLIKSFSRKCMINIFIVRHSITQTIKLRDLVFNWIRKLFTESLITRLQISFSSLIVLKCFAWVMQRNRANISNKNQLIQVNSPCVIIVIFKINKLRIDRIINAAHYNTLIANCIITMTIKRFANLPINAKNNNFWLDNMSLNIEELRKNLKIAKEWRHLFIEFS